MVPAAVVIVGGWIGCYLGIHPPLGESRTTGHSSICPWRTFTSRAAMV